MDTFYKSLCQHNHAELHPEGTQEASLLGYALDLVYKIWHLLGPTRNCLFFSGPLFLFIFIQFPSSYHLTTSSFIYLLQPSFLHFTSLLLFPTDNHLFSRRLIFPLICSHLQSQTCLLYLIKLHHPSAHPEDGDSWFLQYTNTYPPNYTESQLNLSMLQFEFTIQAANKHLFTVQLMLLYRTGFGSINTPFKQGFSVMTSMSVGCVYSNILSLHVSVYRAIYIKTYPNSITEDALTYIYQNMVKRLGVHVLRTTDGTASTFCVE